MKLLKLPILIKQESITSQKPGSCNFRQIANTVFHKVKSAIPPILHGPEVLSSISDKAKLFAKNFSKSSNFDDSDISLPAFHSRTNLKLHNISVTSKFVKKVTNNKLVKDIWFWWYPSGGSEELWAWTFLKTSWFLQYVRRNLVFQIF